MKKLFSLVLAVAMVLSMACFASAEENTTLTIVAWDVGTTPYYQAQKEAFEATHPGVTIEYVDVASQDWDTKAGTMLSGGDTSDLFMVKQNINIMNWAQQGFAEPLTDYIAKDNYDLSGFVGMEPNYALDGTQYALPFRSDFWVLFYNKTLFDAAEVLLRPRAGPGRRGCLPQVHRADRGWPALLRRVPDRRHCHDAHGLLVRRDPHQQHQEWFVRL